MTMTTQTPRPSRAGKRQIGGYFDPAVQRELKMIAAGEDTNVQALLDEALTLLFKQRGRELPQGD